MSTQNNSTVYRPKAFAELVGQAPTIATLRTQVQGYKNTKEPLQHTLFLGSPGLGKTTLAKVLADEMGVGFRDLSASNIKTSADLIEHIKVMGRGDILFLDEIHNLPADVQQWLLTVLLTFQYEARDSVGRSVTLQANPFTLVGATTDMGDLDSALRTRFPYKHQLTDYSDSELALLLQRRLNALNKGVLLSEVVAGTIARLSHKTARTAINLLNLLRDVAKAHAKGICSENFSVANLKIALRQNGIDAVLGLDPMCRRYLVALEGESAAVGESTIMSLTGLKRRDITEVIEPMLMREVMLKVGEDDYLRGSLVRKTTRGRVLTDVATTYLSMCRGAQKSGWFPAEQLRPCTGRAERVRGNGEPFAV